MIGFCIRQMPSDLTSFFFSFRNADLVLIAIRADALRAHQRQKLHFISVFE